MASQIAPEAKDADEDLSKAKGGRCEAIKNFIVNQVNPKFKEYNFPLSLSIVIGTITMAITFVIFWQMFTSCSLTTISDTGREFDEQKGFDAKLTGCACIVRTSSLEIDQLNMALEMRPCIYTAAFSNQISIDNYCEDIGIRKELVADTQAMSGFKRVYTDPDGIQHDEGAAKICAADGLLHANCRMCPDWYATLGAALGYAGLVELVVTVPLVFLLVKIGCLRGGPEGHQGEMLKSLLAERGTGLELANKTGAAPTPSAMGKSAWGMVA